MDKNAELSLFLEKADELIESKYIIADVKIVGLLKAIAASDTLVAIFKNCLNEFDYNAAKKKYLVKSKYLAEGKGEFVLPSSSRDLLSFVFCVLMDIDAKNIDFAQFINKYFYEDGSCSTGYGAFLNAMIKPFVNSVKMLMESVIEGKLQDPLEALTEEEARREKEAKAAADRKIKDKELSVKAYGESVKKLRAILLADKTRIKNFSAEESLKKELLLVVDMFGNALDSGDKDAVIYAFIAYKYALKAKKRMFSGRIRKVRRYYEDVINGL